MHAYSPLLFTNTVSSDYLRRLGEAVHADDQSPDRHPKPALAIYRIAVEGSKTRHGGVVKRGSSVLRFDLSDGRKVGAACKGDFVEYADGSTATIITTAGKTNSFIAVVGSRLSNGDEIVATPLEGALYVAREDKPLPEDFLTDVEA